MAKKKATVPPKPPTGTAEATCSVLALTLALKNKKKDHKLPGRELPTKVNLLDRLREKEKK